MKTCADSRLNPINNVLRQLGEEMRSRRRSTESCPPPHIQLATISLVEGAADGGAPGAQLPHGAGMPPSSPADRGTGQQPARDSYQGGSPCPGARPMSGSPQNRLRSNAASVASTASALSSAPDVLAFSEPQQQAQWAQQLQQDGMVSGSSMRKLPRPSSGRNACSASMDASQPRSTWSSAGIISHLLNGESVTTMVDGARLDAGTPRSASLRRRADQVLSAYQTP